MKVHLAVFLTLALAGCANEPWDEGRAVAQAVEPSLRAAAAAAEAVVVAVAEVTDGTGINSQS